MSSILKKPSAWLPLAMSLADLGLVLGYLAIAGIHQHPGADEGAAALFFQLLMAGQVPFIGYFAISWLPRHLKQAMPVLALQIFSAIAVFSLVVFLKM